MKRTTGWALAAVVVVLLGCGSGGVADDPDAKDAAAPPAAGANAEATTPAVKKKVPTAKDIDLTVKITEKQCFGSAGCNVEFRIVVAVTPEVAADKETEYLVTYEVSGVTDGPKINSFTLQGGKYSSDEEFASTKSKNTKLTAKVTDIEVS